MTSLGYACLGLSGEEPPETLPGKSKWDVGLGGGEKKMGLTTGEPEGEE